MVPEPRKQRPLRGTTRSACRRREGHCGRLGISDDLWSLLDPQPLVVPKRPLEVKLGYTEDQRLDPVFTTSVGIGRAFPGSPRGDGNGNRDGSAGRPRWLGPRLAARGGAAGAHGPAPATRRFRRGRGEEYIYIYIYRVLHFFSGVVWELKWCLVGRLTGRLALKGL